MSKHIKDKNYYYDIIRINIRKYREEKGFSKRKLAQMIDYSEDYIKEIESLTKKKSFQ